MLDWQHHSEALKDLLGVQGVISADQGLGAYEKGARHDGGQAALVLRPETTEAVSKAVAYCVRHGLKLLPQGAVTGLVSASSPDGSGEMVILSLDRLTNPFDLNRGNRSIHVGAGQRLWALNEKLAPHGLTFPIDLGADPMIGGMVATNTGGSRFLRYGDVQDHILGLKVVLADEDGTVLDFMSHLRKNNTGVDWKQLFVGTGGYFGIVTEIILNLSPAVTDTATAFLVPNGDDEVTIILQELERQLGPHFTAFESLSKNAIKHALHHVGHLKNPFPNGEIPEMVLLVEASRTTPPFDGEISLDDMLEQVLGRIWDREDRPLADAFLGRPEEMWAIRHSLSEGMRHAGYLFGFDVSFARQDVMRFRRAMIDDLPALFPDLEICDFGHVGDGGLHLNLVHPDLPDAMRKEYDQRLRDYVYDRVVHEFGGSYSAEHGIGPKNQKFYDRYTPESHKDLAEWVKKKLSPYRLGHSNLGKAS